MPFFRKHKSQRILYLTAQRLTVYEWHRNVLTPVGSFSPDAEGVADFGSYLATPPAMPLYLVADLIEEDFRNETTAHVLGKDRQELLDRKLAQLFRASEYRCAQIQGREEQGRKDDKVLFSALTNNDLLAPWVRSILEHKIPLTGISSAPLLMEVLARHGDFMQRHHMLLVSMNRQIGLRQTYLQEGHLKFSRLSPIPVVEIESLSETVRAECRHTRQYLERLKLIQRDQPLEIHLYTTAEVCAELSRSNPAVALQPFYFYEIEAIAREFGAGSPPEELGVLGICLALALRAKGLPNHYAAAAATRYHGLRRLRLLLNLASTSAITLSLAIGLPPLLAGIRDLSQTKSLNSEARLFDEQYQVLRQNFPAAPISAGEMKSIVETVDAIRKQTFSPIDMMALVSRALANCREIELQGYEWRQAPVVDPESGAAALGCSSPGAGSGQQAAAGGLVQTMLTGKTGVTTILQCSIQPFSGYQNVYNSVSRFVAELETNQGIKAIPLKMPIETGLANATRATLDGEGIKAEFTLKIEYRPVP